MTFRKDLPRNAGAKSNRRGPRLNSRVPVAIEWNSHRGSSRLDSAFTRVVNNYGCLLVSPQEVELQQRLRVTNLSTQQAAEAVVVWKGVLRSDGWDLGVELLSPEFDFWGMEL
jgi:hypothetical protein